MENGEEEYKNSHPIDRREETHSVIKTSRDPKLRGREVLGPIKISNKNKLEKKKR